MTRNEAISIGRRHGRHDVRTVLAEQGIEAVRATLAPGHLDWDEGAINAGAAQFVGVPEALRADYYEAYRIAARELAVELSLDPELVAAIKKGKVEYDRRHGRCTK